MGLGSGRCHYHPERPGLGICVECRRVICTECTTQFEGINRCAKCLGERQAQAPQLVARQDWGLGNVLLMLISIALLYGAFFFLASLFHR